MTTMQKTVALLTLMGLAPNALADEVKVAVAANFTAPMKEIVVSFEQKTGHAAKISYGAGGKFVSQIESGAPFEVFLAADQKNPKFLVDRGEASGQFTYAIGKLVLWSANSALVDMDGKVLGANGFNKLAIANPETAAYGTAAVQVMKTLSLEEALKPKLVQGDNIAQTYQFIATKNADLGFVALSQVITDKTGSGWIVPQSLYEPIRQDAVLLKKGEGNAAAVALLEYLKGTEARAVIEKYGYSLDAPAASQ